MFLYVVSFFCSDKVVLTFLRFRPLNRRVTDSVCVQYLVLSLQMWLENVLMVVRTALLTFPGLNYQ